MKQKIVITNTLDQFCALATMCPRCQLSEPSAPFANLTVAIGDFFASDFCP